MKHTKNPNEEGEFALSDENYDLVVNDINNDPDFIEISKMDELNYEKIKEEILKGNPDFFQKTDNIIDAYSNPNIYDFRKYKLSRSEKTLEKLTPNQFIESLLSGLDEAKYNYLSVINSRRKIFSNLVSNIDNKEYISDIKLKKRRNFSIDIQYLLASTILIMSIIVNIISIDIVFKDIFINQVFGVFLVFACLTIWVNKYLNNKNLNEEQDIKSGDNIKLFSLVFSLLSSVSLLVILLNSMGLIDLYKSGLKFSVSTLFIIMIIPVLRVATKILCSPNEINQNYEENESKIEESKWGSHGYKKT